MLSILAFDDPSPPSAPDDGSPREEEFELVVGRRQIAGLTFLALVMIAVCSGASYLAGKVVSAREEPPAQTIQIEEPPAPVATPLPTPQPTPMIEATIAPQVGPPPSAPPAAPKAAEAPLFANAVPRAIYIQVGAVEKGVATVIAEGLRGHELDAFVAPGPTEKVFRVLIGPFPDAEAYQKAQNIVDRIGLASFARRYQQQ
jgi:cell division septation protein DedD